MWKAIANVFGNLGPKKSGSRESLPCIDDSSDDEKSSNASADEVLECPICWESFNIVENVPYVLWCGHTLCKNCVLGLKWAALNFSNQQIQVPLFISCPWCNVLTLRVNYKGNLRFPSKNYFLLWMVESKNGDRIKNFPSVSGDPLVWSSRCTSVNGNPTSNTLNRRVHLLGNAGSNNGEIGAASATNTNRWNRHQISLQKSLDFFLNLSAKLPLVLVLIIIVVFALPSSAAILMLYLIITVVFAIPAFLVLYFGYPALDWLAREITT